MKYLYSFPDGRIAIENDDGLPITINEAEYPSYWEWATSYLKDNPAALAPVPTIPPPTPEQLAEQRRQAILAALAEIDRRRIRPLAEGEMDRVTALNAQAQSLRAELTSL